MFNKYDDFKKHSSSTFQAAYCKRNMILVREVKFMTDRLKMKDEQNEVVSDWKFAAMVIDR